MGFPNVMDFYQFKVNSKNLDMSKVNFKSHLKILHQLTTPSFLFMIKSSQIDQNVCDWCQILLFFQLFGFPMEQGRIHGNPVADGWAGAVMRKPIGIQNCDRPTDRWMDRHGKV